jgi:hypothetical protein
LNDQIATVTPIITLRTRMSEQYGGQQQTNEELKDKVRKLNVSVSDLFDLSKPWVLVPNGSLLGFFDWVSVSTFFRNNLTNLYLTSSFIVIFSVGARAAQGRPLVVSGDGIPIHDRIFGLHDPGMVENPTSAAIRPCL